MTVSASVAILYTLIGGMYSVAYTDVIQVHAPKIITFVLFKKLNPPFSSLSKFKLLDL